MAAKYRIIADELAAQLRHPAQGGVRLPSEAALAARFGCSRQTIRAALKLLAERGLITTRQGSGSYPVPSPTPHSDQIVLLTADQSEYLHPALIRDLRHTLAKSGYHLTCHDTNDSIVVERALLRQLLKQPLAGVILEPISDLRPNPNTALLRQLTQKNVPIVSLFGTYPGVDAMCVQEDDFDGGYRLVQYLAKKGHRNIAGLFRNDDSRGLERYRGCMQACFDLHLPFDERRFFWYSGEERHMLLEGDRSLLLRFLRALHETPAAVICQNDEIAYHLLAEAKAMDLAVPEHLAAVSFDDSYYATAGSTGITSLGHGAHSAGRQAGEIMLALLQGSPPPSTLLPWQLSSRESA